MAKLVAFSIYVSAVHFCSLNEGMDIIQKFTGLSDEEIDSLTPRVKEEIAIVLDSLSQDTLSLKHEIDTLKSDSERSQRLNLDRINELENEVTTLKDKISGYDEAAAASSANFRLARTECDNLMQKFSELQTLNNELSFAIRNLENEKELLTDQLKQKISLTDELSEEIVQLKSDADSVRKMKMDAMLKMEEIESREVSLQAQESRWSEESASMQRHLSWLEDRLRQTTDQLLTVRRDTTQKCYTLENELELRKSELEHSKTTIESLEQSVKKLTEANEDYIQKIKQVSDEQIKLEQLYGNELEAQKQLVGLYKVQLSEAEEKNSELANAASSMQAMLKSAFENVSRLESERSALKIRFAEERNRLQESVQKLSTELEGSRQLLDKFRVDGLSEQELRQMNPAVAATLSALKRGHSLTQLYSDYIQIVEDRDQLRLDKQRLTEYVKQLVDDLKEKAPILRDQQENYSRLKAQVSELSANLQSANEKLEQAQSQRQDMQRRAGFYQREALRLKQTCADLSKQVQLLLREVEVDRGTVVEEPTTSDSPTSTVSLDPFSKSTYSSHLPDSSTMTSTDIAQLLDDIASSAASVIDEHLVTWKNLRELQSQNQRLLCVARDLAAQLEKREQDEAERSKVVSDLSTRLETLTGELDVVRLASREARSEVKIVTRQRDMYRSMLKRYDIHVSPDRDSDVPAETLRGNGVTPEKERDKFVTNALTSATVERLEETLHSLEAEFKQYREDKAESDKVYTTTVDQLRKEGTEARLLNQKLAAQLDFTHEKLRTMEANVSGYKQEITVLREMNARYATSAASSEAELTRLREELLRTSDKLMQVEVDSRHSTRLLELSRANESRWRQEVESLRRQEQMHTQLMHQLDAIQGNLEQRESLDRTSMEKRIAQLETQLAASQSAFTEASQASKQMKETMDHELEVARQNLASEEEEIARLRTELAVSRQELEVLRPKRDVTISSQDGKDDIDISDHVRESTSRLIELQHEVESLKVRLDISRQQSDTMRQLAETAERRMNDAEDEHKQMEDRLTDELTETKQRCEFLDAQLDLEKTERQNLVNENIRLTEEAVQLKAELRREVSSLQAQLEDANSRCASALELEAGAKSAIEMHGRAAQEARTKYERELTLHAEDVEALSEARQQAESIKAQLGDLQRQLTLAETRSDTVAKELDSMSTSWETERSELQEKLKQADKERDLMEEQIVKLTQQIVALRKFTDHSGTIVNPSDATEGTSEDAVAVKPDDLKTSEDLLQLVNYLRRQKSIAEATCDASSAEVSRLLLRVSSLESHRDHLQQELEKERKANELAMETTQRHSELMQRVEQLNLVTESNRLLRHERETLHSSLCAVEKQLHDIEAQVGPLRAENNELAAQLDSLTSERVSLEEERDRWKERCNRLVETAQRMDPEQYRMACNERDELQRKLRRAEDELQQSAVKLAELRSDMDERTRRYHSELEEARASQLAAEQACEERRASCDQLRQELEAKETTVVKLREIARRYRQETETLRRQLSANRSDGAQLHAMSEALTEVRADLVTTRSDLAAVRSQYSQLFSCADEALQMVESLKSNPVFGSLLTSIHTTIPEASDQTSATSGQHFLDALRLVFSVLTSEFERLHQQAEEQRERILRMQLVESQLTKCQRDCAQLRVRLSELHATPTSLFQPVAIVSSCTSSVMRTDSESSEVVKPTQSFQMRPMLFASTTGASDFSASGPNDSLFSTPNLGTDSCAVSSSNSLATQSIPAWILRAAATVQPVQPTPAVTPPNSSVGPKQTAEIRPITSNIATVVPTPALQIVQTTSVPSPVDSMTTPSIPVSHTSSEPASSTSGPSVTGFQLGEQSTSRPEPASASVLRSVHPRRVNLIAQAQPFGDRQSSVDTVSATGFSWSPLSSAPTNTVVSVPGKRRLDDLSSFTENQPLLSTDEHLSSSSVASPESSRVVETSAGSTSSGLSFLFPDPKRLRTSVSFQPAVQAEPSSVVLERSAFGYPTSTGPLVHATASRLVAGQQETSDSGTMEADILASSAMSAATESGQLPHTPPANDFSFTQAVPLRSDRVTSLLPADAPATPGSPVQSVYQLETEHPQEIGSGSRTDVMLSDGSQTGHFDTPNEELITEPLQSDYNVLQSVSDPQFTNEFELTDVEDVIDVPADSRPLFDQNFDTMVIEGTGGVESEEIETGEVEGEQEFELDEEDEHDEEEEEEEEYEQHEESEEEYSDANDEVTRDDTCGDVIELSSESGSEAEEDEEGEGEEAVEEREEGEAQEDFDDDDEADQQADIEEDREVYEEGSNLAPAHECATESRSNSGDDPGTENASVFSLTAPLKAQPEPSSTGAGVTNASSQLSDQSHVSSTSTGTHIFGQSSVFGDTSSRLGLFGHLNSSTHMSGGLFSGFQSAPSTVIATSETVTPTPSLFRPSLFGAASSTPTGELLCALSSPFLLSI
ncbi:unnamed protein product [Dicrocoelium dendriticum]|nr:unnamed protein product [Dicrocoelium dendriticum]